MDTLTYTLGLTLIGVHITVFALSAKFFGTRQGFLPPNPTFERGMKSASLERGLIAGFMLILAGFGLMAYAVSIWHGTGFGFLTATRMLRLTLPSATALMLGVETVFGSFFLSMLNIKRS